MATALTNQFQVGQVSLSPVSNSKMFTCSLKHGSRINLGSELSGCHVVALPTQLSILYSCKGLQSQILHYYVYKYLCNSFNSLQKLSSLLNDTRRNNICYLVSTPRFVPYCLLGYFLLCKVTYQQQTYSTHERFSRTIKNHHSQVVVIKALPQNLSQATATLDWYASGITTKFVVQLDPTTAAAEFPGHVIKCSRYIVRKIQIDRYRLKQFVL